MTGTLIPDVLPSLQSDTEYYQAQIHEVLEGKIWLGNPYIREYDALQSPSLIVPVWIAAIPGLFGLSMPHITIVNMLLYTALTGLLLFFLLLRVTTGNAWLSAGMGVMGVAYVHNLILRPVIMQTIYPLFLVFLLLLYEHVRQPNAKKWLIGLGIMAAISFYVYLYLWMIIFTVLGLLTLQSLLQGNRTLFVRWFMIWAGIFMLITPGIVDVIHILTDPLLHETATRIGVTNTHLVLPISIFNAKYLLLLLAALLGITYVEKRRWSNAERTIFLATLAIVIATFSNVMTGKDMQLGTHMWRFGLIMTTVGCCFFTAQALTRTRGRVLSVGIASILGFTILMHTIIRSNAFPYLHQPNTEAQELQAFAVPLDILNKEQDAGVILADSELSCLIPVYTNHSVVLCNAAVLHPIPTEELLERYLFQHLSQADETLLEQSIPVISGIGPSHQAEYANLKNTLCARTHLCTADSKHYTAYQMAQGDFWKQKGRQLLAHLRSNSTSTFERFHVTHIVIDTLSEFALPQSSNGVSIYEDERWRIVRIP